MQTILGAGGAIGNLLAKELARNGEKVRLVGRNPKVIAGAVEAVTADISELDPAIRAVSGSRVVYLLIGLKYDRKVWQEFWPRIMHNTIEACKRAQARLIFFDNVYMYGRVTGAMTEETPFNPCSRKGEIRALIATTLLNEVKAGNLTALIARAPDFYGPNARNSIPNLMVFDKFAQGSKASWLVDDSRRHSLSFTPDAAKSLVLLAESESAWNQTWHVPTAVSPPTGKELIEMAAGQFGVPPRYRILSRPLIKLGGWFDGNVREIYEMLYQYDSEYLFDSTKFAKAFNFEPSPYAEGIRAVVETYKSRK
jgi:nucleoside-diphosphate-sugar epimerase